LSRAGLFVSLATCLVATSACPPPNYQSVGLQVDLEVSAGEDPFDTIRGLRVCLDSERGESFYLFPSDPGSFLVPEVPTDMLVSLEIQGIDREPDEIELGDDPLILARASVTDAPLSVDGEAGYVSTRFSLCGDDCPTDCGAPVTLPAGEDSIGLRRVLGDSP